MADTEKKAGPEVAEQTATPAQADNLTPPAPDIGGEQPQTDAQEQAKNILSQDGPALDMSGAPGEVVVPSNVIDGLFEEKRAAAREAEKKAAEQDAAAQEPPAAEAQPKKGRGRPPKEDKAGKEPAPDKSGKQKQADNIGGEAKPPAPAKDQDKGGPSLADRKKKLEQELREKYGIPKSDKAVESWIAPEEETVIRIPHEKLHSFKDHPFNVEKNPKYLAFVASIRAHGVTQPAIVRPDGKDGYEIISGHRRDEGSKDAEIPFTPCIVRALNDEQAIQQMVEDNVNNREIGIMELARALNMQLNSIKRQGARDALSEKNLTSDTDQNIGKRSNEIIAERNGMSVKTVQRHIALTRLTPALQEYVDGKAVDGDKKIKLPFTAAADYLSYIKPKNQNFIAVAIEAQQSAPSGAQAQRMRELDEKGVLNADIIDGIMLEEKKEETRVILNAQELGKYFGPEKTPREMKDTILKLLDEYKEKQPPELGKPAKTKEAEK